MAAHLASTLSNSLRSEAVNVSDTSLIGASRGSHSASTDGLRRAACILSYETGLRRLCFCRSSPAAEWPDPAGPMRLRALGEAWGDVAESCTLCLSSADVGSHPFGTSDGVHGNAARIGDWGAVEAVDEASIHSPPWNIRSALTTLPADGTSGRCGIERHAVGGEWTRAARPPPEIPADSGCTSNKNDLIRFDRRFVKRLSTTHHTIVGSY